MEIEKSESNHNVINFPEKKEKDISEIRKEKIIELAKKPKIWMIGFLIIALILGIYIRSLPLQERPDTGKPGLWDITQDTWTLGPDLDPWLFVRTAEGIIEDGEIPAVDKMRNVPLGFNNAGETQLLPYLIAYTYKIIKPFYPEATVVYAGAIFPVIMFALTIIAFFFFVREIFVERTLKSKIKGNIIAILSTFFMITIPVFLPRTIAGIPEKESGAFFFMFLAFFLFLKSWRTKKQKQKYILAGLSGFATALMGLISGLYIYVFAAISLSVFLTFLLNKIKRKEIYLYLAWWLSSVLLMTFLPGKTNLLGLLTSITTAPAFFLAVLFIIHITLWKSKLKNHKIFVNKIPRNIQSIIVTLILGLILIMILDPTLIFDKIRALNQILFNPTTGRWNITVAENRQPFFTEWRNNFGPIFQGIPLMFWIFFAGSIVLFKKTINSFRKKDQWIMTLLFTLLMFGMIFSRYSSESILNGTNFLSKSIYLNGTNFLSKSIYLLSIAIFVFFLIKIYIKYEKGKDEEIFSHVKYEYLLLLSLFIISVFSARSAVRLIMFLGPIAPILASFLLVETGDKLTREKEESSKMIVGGIFILLLIANIFTLTSYYKMVSQDAYNFVPTYYNQQWQKAMSWVREETPEDAVFAHWWDYGYWVQSIGDRATVLDGGNAISFWNYYMGRHVLTGDNQKDALEFLYAHNASYLLIDPTDIAKYGAFSSIGSDENFDRFSWIPTLSLDESQTHETANKTYYVYTGNGIALDENIVIYENGQELLLPAGKAFFGGFTTAIEGNMLTQPKGIIFYQGQKYEVKIKYASLQEEFYEFEEGIEGTVYLYPRIFNDGQGLRKNDVGVMMYLSPRVTNGFLAQKYILNDPFNEFENFELAHTEPNIFVEAIRQQGIDVPEIIYYNGLQGPIKIWKINYTGEEEFKEKYIDTDPSKYLDWDL